MSLKAKYEALRVDVMTVVSDPHLEWDEARTMLRAALNGTVAYSHDEMMLSVHAGEELRMLTALREPGTSTLLSNTTIDRLIDILARVEGEDTP